ncbi:hypothetical protein BROUX41_004393 [Berkeleyomyces rouxiae]|uniref:uncharacterized protein n=1 Tax=Berkeleyomyces rouxiae TaxID=2035830 RepID=UPI003B78589E
MPSLNASGSRGAGGLWTIIANDRVNYPLIHCSAHTRITHSVAHTTLTQTFIARTKALPGESSQTRYSFPLYDGVSVTSFSCDIEGTTVRGIVKEKQAAREDYEKAAARGENTALLELARSAGDVYNISIGHVSAGAKVKVTIEYVGELKHDAGADGHRFTIPTSVAPRYGEPGDAQDQSLSGGNFNVIVDAELAPGSEIVTIDSPSHPVSVNIGRVSTDTRSSDLSTPYKASVSCTLPEATLSKDFVLKITATGLGEPMAIFERHPTMSDERALMATLVPRFALPLEKTDRPDIVFMCDRSGSMQGESIKGLRASLRIFLKSLPIGAKFNICSFGSSFSLLWPTSRPYDDDSFKEASRLLDNFEADMGGTNIYKPLDAILKQRSADSTLDLIVLTDGQIWNQDQLFTLIRDAVKESKGAVRVFSIGIGGGASSSLIEGIARNGGGFSQAVADGEVMDRKVMRMLKGALSARIFNVTLEVRYRHDTEAPRDSDMAQKDDDDDFVMVEKVADSFAVECENENGVCSNTEEPKQANEDNPSTSPPIPIYDPTADIDQPISAELNSGRRFSAVPDIPVPSIIQTPAALPSLFPSSRISVYLLLSGKSARRVPESVIIRASSTHGQLQQVIPVTVLDHHGTTIHQVASRKATQELEQGLGWLHYAFDTAGTLLRDKYPGKFDDIVHREIVRLGVKYQIASKHTSYVAIESKPDRKPVEIDDGLTGLSAPPGASATLFSAPSRSIHQPGNSLAACRLASVAPCSAVPKFHSLDAAGSPPRSRCIGGGRSAAMLVSRRAHSNTVPVVPSAFGSTFMPAPALSPQVESISMPKRESPPPKSPLDIIIETSSISGSWSPSQELMKVLGTTTDALIRKAKGVSDVKVLVTAAVVGWLEKNARDEQEIWELLAEKARVWLRSEGSDAEGLIGCFP